MDTELITTKDGSHSLFVPELNEIYHSANGAIQESNHVFIEAGLKQFAKKEIEIFEIGFGTGLNAFLTLNHAINNQIKIKYNTIEKFPVDYQTLQRLNYTEIININLQDVFYQLHSNTWSQQFQINEYFELFKIKDDISNFSPDFEYDLIFFDAFAPDIQPELWTIEIFQKLYDKLKPNGILTTYSAKGEVKRNLKACGFEIEKIPGPPGKREMIRATKNA